MSAANSPSAPRRFSTIVLVGAIVVTWALLSPRLSARETSSGSSREDRVPGSEEVVALIDAEPLTRAAFRIRLARRYQGTPSGQEAQSQTIEKYLVRKEMKSRRLDVTDAEIARRLDKLNQDVVRESQGQSTLEKELARNEVDLESFKEQLRFLVGLEKMARRDFSISESEAVPSVKLNLWLQDLRDRAEIVLRNPSPSSSEEDAVFAEVGGEKLTLEMLGAELESNLPPSELERDLTALAGCRIIEKTLEEMALRVTKEDLDEEIARRQKALGKKPGLEGVTYESVLQQTKGITLEQLYNDEEFISQVGLKKIVDSRYEGPRLQEYFDENADRFGRSLRARHLMIRGAESESPYQTSVRSFEEALKEIETIRNELEKDPTLAFSDLIKNRSEDKRNEGGDLGFLHRENPLGPEFFDRVWALEPGTVSAPIHSPFGFHLVQLLERRDAPELTAVTDEIQGALMKEVYRQLWDEGDVQILLSPKTATSESEGQSESEGREVDSGK